MHEEKNPLIAHPRDPRFLALQSLQSNAGRQRTGQFLIEGVRHVARAVEQRVRIDLLFTDPSALSSRFGQKLARRVRQSGVPSIRLAPSLYRELTLAAEPQGIGATLRQLWSPIAEIRPGRDSIWLAVESIDQPGNLGTIIRTAEAAGVTGIFMLGSQIDPWDSACVRATMGSLFSLKLVRCTARELTQWTKQWSVAAISSSPSGLLDYKALSCRRPAVLLVGSEKTGLSPELLEASDFIVRIPMRGRSDSINAAVATGVLLFELSSQHIGARSPNPAARLK